MKPELEIIRSLRWDAFCTFTFRNPLPPQRRQKWLLEHFLRIVAKHRQIFFGEFLYMWRFELGETNEREHYHGLISFKTGPVHQSFLSAMEHVWQDLAGHAQLREFNPSLDGVDYVYDGVEETSSWCLTSANKYEVQKFGRAETHVPESVKRVVLAAQRRSGFWCVKCDNQKAVCTCSVRKLAKSASSAVMRGQSLGAVEHATITGVTSNGV